MGITRTIQLQTAATAPGNGVSFTPEYSDAMIVEVHGTATSFQIIFEELGPSGTWYPLQGMKRSDMATLLTEATAVGMYYFGMSDVKTFRARVVAVSGGSISVTGHTIVDEM